jgi:hypothetical protein
MKTKNKYKKSLSRAVPDQTPTARLRAADRVAVDDSSASGLLNFSTVESTEQTQNVYENKEQVQKVAESCSTSA